MADFKKGDVVQLKSDEQKMTVDEVKGNLIHCSYHDKDNNRKGEFFDKDSLVKVDDK